MPGGEQGLFFCLHVCLHVCRSAAGEERFPGLVRRSFWSLRTPGNVGYQGLESCGEGACRTLAISPSHCLLVPPTLGLLQPQVRGPLWLCHPQWQFSVRGSTWPKYMDSGAAGLGSNPDSTTVAPKIHVVKS